MQAANKVAAITLSFWMMKILATTLGETAGDMLAMTLDAGYTVGLLVTMGILLVLLLAQVRADRFHPSLYWAAIIGTTTAGTEISDFMDRTLGIGYMWGSVVLVSGLALVLGLWHRSEKSLRVYPITRKGPEIFFWAAVLFSNSLGTAFGDFLTDDAGLSYMQGALVTFGVIGVVAGLHYVSKINQVLLFWLAFIFTRPFGATFGDLLTKPLEHGGLGLSTIWATAVTMALFIGIFAVARKQHQE
ncbi:MAG: hypothetical protein GC134_06990 [Proteobacteria bacterium]|nr:hypothetical protein [Pseudomonadota bacterium]